MNDKIKLLIIATGGSAINFAAAFLLMWVFITPGSQIGASMLAGFLVSFVGALAALRAREMLP